MGLSEIKTNKLNRQDNIMPQTIPQLIQKYALNTLWDNIEKIVKEVIEQNSGYTVKRDGYMYIADTKDITHAEIILRLGKDGLYVSTTGFIGEYLSIISTNGTINADFIKTGELSATRIKGGTLTLGGIENGNGQLVVLDEQGSTLAYIGKDGVIFKNGTKLIGSDGLLSVLQYGDNSWNNIGFTTDIQVSLNYYSSKDISIKLPDNFLVEEAYVIIEHAPIKQMDYVNNTNYWGYCRNLKVFRNLENANYYKELPLFPSEDYSDQPIYTDEITGAFGSNGFTASIPSDLNHTLQTIKSSNIASYIQDGMSLQIRSGNSIPAFSPDIYDNYNTAWFQRNCVEATGYVRASVHIIGRIK